MKIIACEHQDRNMFSKPATTVLEPDQQHLRNFLAPVPKQILLHHSREHG
jgi:hypothetical protein